MTTTPPTMAIATSAHTLDEDLNNIGTLIAFNGEAGPNVVNPAAAGTNQMTIADSDSANFDGGSLAVSVPLGNMSQLRLGISGTSGVFKVINFLGPDGVTSNITYYADARYTGTDITDGTGAVITKRFSQITPGTADNAVVIGTLDAIHKGQQ